MASMICALDFSFQEDAHFLDSGHTSLVQGRIFTQPAVLRRQRIHVPGERFEFHLHERRVHTVAQGTDGGNVTVTKGGPQRFSVRGKLCG